MSSLRTILTLVTLLALVTASEDHCYALVLEGGGDKGAFQAGAIHEIIYHHADETVAYDIITGISVGAVNGGGLSNYAQGDELAAADYILELWRGLSREDVMKDWAWGGVVRGILFKTGIYNDEPLIDYLRAHVESPKREFIYGLTDASSGAYVAMDTHESLDRYILGIVGSSTFPGVFPAMKDLDQGHQYYDGAVSRTVDIVNAVNHCKKNGFEEKDITVDIILCGGATFRVDDASQYHPIKQGLRYLEIRNFYSSMDLVIRAKDAFRDVNWRYTIAPTTKLETGLIPDHFDPVEIEHNIEAGIRDARAAFELPEGQTMTNLIEYYFAKGSGKTNLDYGKYLEEKY